ncbi:MAG: helix-turn-helix domain-containing protein [Rhodospirillales bacterium]|nr:helix-turn-helix domain-containing protein [Rhodospirillales bacterium]
MDNVAGDNAGTDAGAILRAARIRHGDDLDKVAERLRIRLVYLEAIEGGRFSELPGPTYAVGFIRSYAELLGLDGDLIVNRYRNEITADGSSPKLVFPTADSENSIPRGALVMVGLLAAVVAYGLWYFVNTEDRQASAPVEPVPKQIAAATGIEPEPVAKKPDASEAEAAPAISKGESVGVGEGKTKQQESENPAEMAIAPVAPTVAPAAAIVEPEAAAKPSEPTEPSPSVADQPEPPKTEPPKAEPAAEIAAAVTPAPESQPAASPPPTEAPSTSETPQAPAVPEQLASTEPTERAAPAPPPVAELQIVIKALSDSWIRVRDNNAGKLLVTKLLRTGDSYKVPKRSGLSLLTGNAGALQIEVDGILVPSIGPVGTVRRNVVLEADRLSAGTAVVE